MTAGTAGTPKATASQFVTDGNSVVIPPGADIAPHDWEVGNIVSIIARIRTIEIFDGGGTMALVGTVLAMTLTASALAMVLRRS